MKQKKLYFEVLLWIGLTWDTKGTFRLRIYYNPFQKNEQNQYIMLEWYVDQAQRPMDYKEFTSMVRIGHVLKGNEINFLRGKWVLSFQTLSVKGFKEIGAFGKQFIAHKSKIGVTGSKSFRIHNIIHL